MAVKGTQLQKGKPIVGAGALSKDSAVTAQTFLPCGCNTVKCSCGKGG